MNKMIQLYPNNNTKGLCEGFFEVVKNPTQNIMIDFLQSLVNYAVDLYNIRNLSTVDFVMKEQNGGSFNYINNSIEVSVRNFRLKSLPSTISTIFHEMYHCYQKNTRYFKTYNQCQNNPSHKFAFVNSAIKHYDIYRNLDIYGYSFYFVCDLETEARKVAEQNCDNLLNLLQEYFLKKLASKVRNRERKAFAKYLQFIKKSFSQIENTNARQLQMYQSETKKYLVNDGYYESFAFKEIVNNLQKGEIQDRGYIAGLVQLITNPEYISTIKKLAFNTNDIELITEVINSPNVFVSKSELMSFVNFIKNSNSNKSIDECLYLWDKSIVAEISRDDDLQL